MTLGAGRKPGRPRRSVRLRLTLTYGSLFFFSGVALLAITYALVANQPPLNAGQLLAERPATGTGPPLPELASPEELRAAQEKNQADLEKQAAAILREFVVQSGVSLTLMTFASIGLGWFVAGRVLRPLRTITTTAQTISVKNLHERLALEGPNDELKELGDTFDRLLGRLESSFDAQRHFAANVSHELRTPLTRSRTLLEVAASDPAATVETLRQACDRALLANQHQERLIEALLTLARSERTIDQGELVDLRAVTREYLLIAQPQAHARELKVEARLDGSKVWGDPRLIERLVSNLIDNAVRHNVTGGLVQVVTASRSLLVANTGPVVGPGEIARLLEPFQRQAPDRLAARDGHGLGLAIVRSIARTHDAGLDVRPRAGGGLEVEVSFPAH
jgi:signal transduction histidine kinase